MTEPRLEACYFEQPGSDGRWPRLAAVLERTAIEHCPGWQVAVRRIPCQAGQHGMRQWLFESNSLKLEHWNALVQQAPDGDRILLIDADMLVVRPLDPVWDRPFDVAYTVRPSGAKFPLNGGVVAVRVGAASRAFMQAWAAENRRMLNDQAHHNRWRQRFGGINQAALGALLAAGVRGQFATLPCLEWNCEDSCWGKFDPAVTRLVHIKSELRLACRSRADQRGRWQPIVDRWRAADRESLRASA